MSEWMVRKPYKLSNGKFRPRVGNSIDERLALSEFECSSEREAREVAMRWIIQQENLSDEEYIKDKHKTIKDFLDEFYLEWRYKNYKAPAVHRFVRYLEENDWMKTRLSSITTKWCIEYRRRIPDFKQKDGSDYDLKSIYKDLVAELNHFLKQAMYEQYVVRNFNYRLPNPNQHLFQDDISEEIDRAFDREDKVWTAEQVNEYLPRFQNIPATRVYTNKRAEHQKSRKATVVKSDNAEAWKVRWVDNDGSSRSKNFNWKKNGGSEPAKRKAEAYAKTITDSLEKEDIYVTEKGQFDGIDTIMWFAFFNISLQLGLRVGEIAGLKLSDFSSDGKFVSIKRQRVIRNKLIVEDAPKANSKRRISVPDKFRLKVLPLLREYHHMNGTEKYDYVLQYRNGGAIRPDYWRKQFLKVQELVGIPKEEMLPTTHCGRHTHLTVLASANVPIVYLKKRAGHRNIKTTANYYIHLADDVEASMAMDIILSDSEANLGVNNG